MPNLCQQCGANIDLVGIRHRCVPRQKLPGATVALKEVRSGRPRLGQVDATIEANKPWVGLGMSRATWYRRRTEKTEKVETQEPKSSFAMLSPEAKALIMKRERKE